jgi:hypothetical protein
VTSTQYSGAVVGLPGFLQFTFAGSHDLQGIGEQAVIAAMQDENSFVFLMFQDRLLEVIRNFVDAKIACVDVTDMRSTVVRFFADYQNESDLLQLSIGNINFYGDRMLINGTRVSYTTIPHVFIHPTRKEPVLSCNFHFDTLTPMISYAVIFSSGYRIPIIERVHLDEVSTYLQTWVGLRRTNDTSSTGCCSIIAAIIITLILLFLGWCFQ